MPGQFRPFWIHLSKGQESYLQTLWFHKAFLENSKVVTVFGINKDSLMVRKSNSLGKVHTFKDYVLKRTGAVDLVRTARTNDLGKFNLIVHCADIEKVKAWVDTKLPTA